MNARSWRWGTVFVYHLTFNSHRVLFGDLCSSATRGLVVAILSVVDFGICTFVKSALGMSQGTLNTVLAGIAAITGMISIVIAVRHNRQRTKEQEKDRRLVMEQKRLIEQQLELSRDQASSLPLIELMEFSVHPLEENQELFQEVSCAQQAMVAPQEKRAEDERRAGPCRA